MKDDFEFFSLVINFSIDQMGFFNEGEGRAVLKS